MGTGPRLNKEQRTLLSDFAWHKRTSEGWTHAKIAAEFKALHGVEVDRSTVTRALNRVDKNAKERIQNHAIQAIFEGAAILDRVIELAFVGAETPNKDGEIESGWLNTIISAVGAKLKALGADVQKIELTGKDGGPVAMDDARSKLARLLAAHAAVRGSGGVAGQPNG